MAYAGLGQTVGQTVDQCVEDALGDIPPGIRRRHEKVVRATCRKRLAEHLLTAVEAAGPDPGTYPMEGPVSSTAPVQPGAPIGGTYTSGPAIVQPLEAPPPPVPTGTGPAPIMQAGIGELFAGGTLLPVLAGVAVLGALIVATRSR